MDNHYPREEAFVLRLLERLKLQLAGSPWNPNSDKFQSGADVALLTADGLRAGIQVTEVDPFPGPGTRGHEQKQVRASATGVVGNYVQNDMAAVLDAICRSIRRKVRIVPDKHLFAEVWLLLCVGVPDAPTSTFIPTAPLTVVELNDKTATQLANSHYSECFILPFFSTEQAIYRWSRSRTARWKKSVLLEEIALGTARDAEYVRELLQTGGCDERVLDAQVGRVLEELRGR